MTSLDVAETPAAAPPLEDDPAARPVVTLLPGGHRRAEGGHPWIYSNEVQMDAAAKELPPGCLVTLKRPDGRALGVAMFNPHTLLAARLLDRDTARPIGRRFLLRRLERALKLREQLYRSPYYRLVHAEADGLPGLVVDRFGKVLVVQANAAGMDRLEPAIIEALGALLEPEAIVLRNDGFGARDGRAGVGGAGRARCGRRARAGRGERVDLRRRRARRAEDRLVFRPARQPRFCRRALARRAGHRPLLLFRRLRMIAAACGGAAAVTEIDPLGRRARARRRGGHAWQRRRLTLRLPPGGGLRRGRVARRRRRTVRRGNRFDPPAFARSRRDVPAALRGYRKLARLAAGLATPAGIVFLASCSHNVPAADFAEAARRGLADAGRTGRILREAGAGPDHPVHMALPETAYLKSLTLALD